MRGDGETRAITWLNSHELSPYALFFHFNRDFDDYEEKDLCQTMLSGRVLNFRTRKFAYVQETRKSVKFYLLRADL